MKVVVVTCLARDMASLCLPELVKSPAIELSAVIRVVGGEKHNRRYYWRKFKKVLKIGLLGAWNGKRIRPWFRKEYEDLRVLCRQNGVPYHEVEGLNSQAMVDLLTQLSPELALSLGNGFIAERVFTIPKRGFVNVHSEILPRYQNAQSIVWPIYNMDPHSGYAIHEISRKIDAGRILYQKRVPLRFYPRLQDTVYQNKIEIEQGIPQSLVYVCENIEDLQARAVPQGPGGHYTTPSFWQFLRMAINNARLYRRQQKGAFPPPADT